MIKIGHPYSNKVNHLKGFNCSINDLLIGSESQQDKFTCSICFEVVYNKEIYQCKESHWNCKECWIKLLKKRKECTLCKEPISSISDLGRNRFIEKEFTLQEIYCPNSKRDKDNKVIGGCKEIITIEKLGSHLKEHCKFNIVKCTHHGCDIKNLKLSNLKQHLEECKFKPVKCKNNCNKILIQRQMYTHYKVGCPNQMVPCKYETYGCITMVKRSDLISHLQTINHTTLLEKQIDQLSKEVSTLKKSNIEESRFYKGNWEIPKSALKTFSQIQEGQNIISNSIHIGAHKFVMNLYPAGIHKRGTGDRNVEITLSPLELTNRIKVRFNVTPCVFEKNTISVQKTFQNSNEEVCATLFSTQFFYKDSLLSSLNLDIDIEILK